MTEKTGVEVALDYLGREVNQQRQYVASQVVKSEEFQKEVLRKLNVCPEASHIQQQNGTIAKLANNVHEVREEIKLVSGKVSVWVYIFAALIATLTISVFVSGLISSKTTVKPRNVLEAVKSLQKEIKK